MKTTNGNYIVKVDTDGEVFFESVDTCARIGYIRVDDFKKLIPQVLAKSIVADAKDEAETAKWRVQELLEDFK